MTTVFATTGIQVTQHYSFLLDETFLIFIRTVVPVIFLSVGAWSHDQCYCRPCKGQEIALNCTDRWFGLSVSLFRSAFLKVIFDNDVINGNIFRVTDPLQGEFTGHRWIPSQRPVTRSFDVFFDLRLNKRLSKQLWGWCFETPQCSLWRHCNVWVRTIMIYFERL